MKVAFAGPSLAGVDVRPQGVDLRPPAAQGDVMKAVDDGATAIGIIDGYFGWTASVWHKEILYALSLGVRVFGSSSMGALRAAECAAFGMVPIGQVARSYAAGELDDDDAVALTHLPAEFGYMPTTEPLVDALPTIGHLRRRGLVSPGTAELLALRARTLHFAERTVEGLCALEGLDDAQRQALCRLYEANRVNAKQRDALELLEVIARVPDERLPPPRTWDFAESPMWRHVRSGSPATAL